MAVYRDQVVRLSLPVIRARFKPSAFEKLKTVRLAHGGFVVDVELVRVPAPGLPSGWRTAMRCPRCSRAANVIGCVPEGHWRPAGWACAKCGAWRGRPRCTPAYLKTLAPHEGAVSTRKDDDEPHQSELASR